MVLLKVLLARKKDSSFKSIRSCFWTPGANERSARVAEGAVSLCNGAVVKNFNDPFHSARGEAGGSLEETVAGKGRKRLEGGDELVKRKSCPKAERSGMLAACGACARTHTRSPLALSSRPKYVYYTRVK